MANGKFEPGNPGGPGRPSLPPELRESMKYGRIEAARAIQDLFGKTPTEVRKILDDLGTDCLVGTFAQILAIARMQGDFKRLNFLLENAFGKLPQNINLGALAGEKRLTHADVIAAIEAKIKDKNGDT